MQLNLPASWKALAFSIALGLSLSAWLVPAASEESLAIANTERASNNFLKVKGSQLQDGQGQTVLLRGVNIHTYYYQYQWDKTAALKNANEADIKYLKSLGVNSIRLGLHWQYFQSNLGYQLIDNYVKWCEDAGIYLILDMHVVPPDTDFGQGKIWNNQAAQQKFIKLWKTIAKRYANQAVIAGYDLFNEPAPTDPQHWWDLAAATINAIRSVDSKHILFLEPALSGDESFHLVNDKNVVYSFHDYQPFIISHAGYDWAGDSRVPTTYVYPGLVLKDLYWVDWAKANTYKGKIAAWRQIDSGEIIVPAGVQFATAKLSANGRVGSVWFDDVTVEKNGVAFKVFNPSIEKASILNSNQPANWSFWGTGDFTGSWDRTINRPGADNTHKASLKITGNSIQGIGAWTQENGFYTEPLIQIVAGDKIRLTAWVYAPEVATGELSIRLDYLNGNYELYNKDRLSLDMQPYITWAKNNNVPLHVGEFGALSSARGASRYNLVRDKISVMNEAGLSWSLWSYRDLGKPYFGLYLGKKLDKRLAAELKNGLQ